MWFCFQVSSLLSVARRSSFWLAFDVVSLRAVRTGCVLLWFLFYFHSFSPFEWGKVFKVEKSANDDGHKNKSWCITDAQPIHVIVYVSVCNVFVCSFFIDHFLLVVFSLTFQMVWWMCDRPYRMHCDRRSICDVCSTICKQKGSSSVAQSDYTQKHCAASSSCAYIELKLSPCKFMAVGLTFTPSGYRWRCNVVGCGSNDTCVVRVVSRKLMTPMAGCACGGHMIDVGVSAGGGTALILIVDCWAGVILCS